MKNNAQSIVTPVAEDPIELAFGVVRGEDKLYAIKMIMYQGHKILGIRISNGTTLGHALTEAEDMLSHFNLYKVDGNTKDPFAFHAKTYFETTRML